MIDEKILCDLRKEIENAEMSEKRRRHTLAVEDMAVRLGELYAPESLDVLRAAALLHDITKEYTSEEHTAILIGHGIAPRDIDIFAPKTLHAQTAALLIPEKYAESATPEVISAVRWHTTGHAGMTVCEKLTYLADYIDETRKFPDCVKLREMFWSAEPQKMNEKEKEAHLRRVLIESYKMTVTALLDEGCPISPDTVDALNELIIEERKNENGRKD